MTGLRGAYLTPDHQVRRPQGTEHTEGWAEEWTCAGDDIEAQPTLREQPTLVNIEVTQAHGILLGNGYLAKTLSSPTTAAAIDSIDDVPLPPSPVMEPKVTGFRGPPLGMQANPRDVTLDPAATAAGKNTDVGPLPPFPATEPEDTRQGQREGRDGQSREQACRDIRQQTEDFETHANKIRSLLGVDIEIFPWPSGHTVKTHTNTPIPA